jgi:serine/threonine protein kinase/WD40 repeat protein
MKGQAMNPEAQRVRDLFVAAFPLPPEQWDAFLEEACAGDEELRRQVSDLLGEHQQAGSFLDRPVAQVQATGDFDPTADPFAAAASEEGPGSTIGPYKLLELIGEGGMGTVWMAEQRQPVQRKVALKIIKAGMDSKQVVARFEAERQALALMDHPHIARVFDGGTTLSGRPYFVMDLVKGVPITTYCDEHRLTPRERLELFVSVCQAIQHAHTKGLIHRDVKPGNVLVAPYDGVPVPKVIDFGVAKATGQPLTERTLCTGFGAVVGTLEYMSPEQAELNNRDIDTRSDIYALGVLLYELLTGTTPLRRERLKQAALTEVLRAIREEEPPRPSTRLSESQETLPSISAQRHMEPAKLRKVLRGELDWIVMKALEKDRSRRYETANAFALDVQRYLADEPVQACPPSTGYRLRKFVRRNKGPVLAVGLVLLTLVAGIVGTTWGLVSAHKALSELHQQQTKTQSAERDKTLELAQLRWNEARLCRQARRPGQRYRSLEALAETVRHLRSLNRLEANRSELRDDALAALTLWDVRAVKNFPAERTLWWESVDPLGQYYASFEVPNVVSLRRVMDDKVMHRWPWEGSPCFSLGFSPDGRYVFALCGEDPQRETEVCRVWDGNTGHSVLEHRISPNRGHAFRPNSTVLALAQGDGSITLCDLSTGRDAPAVPAGPLPERLRFHPSGRYLAVSFFRQPDVVVWDLVAEEIVLRLAGDRYAGGSLAWSPDGSLLAVGSRDSNIYVCTFPGGKIQAVLRGHEHVVTRVEYHPSGRLLASTSHDDTTRLWCFSPGGELVLPGERLLGFSDDARRLITVSWQGATEWEVVDPGDCLHYLPHGEGTSRGPWRVAFAADSRLLASASQDGVLLWDAATAHLLGRVPSGRGYALAFSADGRELFTTGPGGWVRWPIVPDRDGKTLRVGPGKVLRATASDSRSLRIAVAGTGESVLLGTGDGEVDLVPLDEPTKARRLGRHDGLFGVALSPDGHWAASAGGGDTVCVWDVAQGTLARRLAQGRNNWGGATFSPDGRWLVTGSRNDFCFWGVGSWEQEARLPRDPRSLFSSLAFARDGRLLALVDGRHRIRLYDAATLPLRHLATLETPEGPANLTGLSLSPDGTRLAATTDYNVIALWDLRQLRQELSALDLDWEMPPYPVAGLTQDLNVEVLPAPTASR